MAENLWASLEKRSLRTESLPYVLTICDAPVTSLDGACPDGFTLTIGGSKSVQRALSQIAPSEYQANWRRSGGVVDGGPAVTLMRDDIIPTLGGTIVQWLDGFDFWNFENWQPPIPIDFVSAIAIAQGQQTLPAFAAPLNETPLTSFPFPVWQIYHAPWKRRSMAQDALDPAFILQGILVRLRATVPELQRQSFFQNDLETARSQDIYGLRLQGSTASEVKSWTFLRNNSAQTGASLQLQRSIRMRGLTFFLDTTVRIDDADSRFLRPDCELVLDQLLPSSLYLNADEAQDHARIGEISYVTPQFHDVELPSHLASPAVFRTKFRLASGKYEYHDVDLSLHARYLINYDSHDSQETEYPDIELQPPSASIVCATAHTPGFDSVNGVFKNVVSYPPSTYGNPYANVVRGMLISATHEGMICQVTSFAVLMSMYFVARNLFRGLQKHKAHRR